MLSISSAIAAGQGRYFGSLAREDYYTEGGEPPGHWFGRGLETFGLSDQVDPHVFQYLLQGYSPDGHTPLVQNAGDPPRQAAWDLTFSAPKSLSVLWSQADAETQQIIQEVHALAVMKALAYLEDVAAFTRRGHAGQRLERAAWIVAMFEHGTSRAQDPQLHTHAVLLNLAVRADGSTGTLVSREVFRHKMAAGALYRAELAALLQERLGLGIERVKTWFEVEGVSPALIAEFSKRRQQIEAELKTRGQEGAVAAKQAALHTRSAKEHLPRELLIRTWREAGHALGWSTAEVEILLRSGQDRSRDFVGAGELATDALAVITAHQSFFPTRDLVRRLAEASQGQGLGAAGVRLAAEQTLATPEIVPLGRVAGERQFTTKEMLQVEQELFALALQAQDSRAHTLPPADLGRFPNLSLEQEAAVRHITNGVGAVQVVSGMAGTGKSTLLRVARLLWQEAGLSVWGAALSGKAARGLEASSGIPSVTCARLIQCLAQQRSPFADDSSPLNARTVLVLDEAAMLGTRQMKTILEAALAVGAKVVMAGDAKQLQPIEAGGPFRALSERLGEARLVEIQRQRDEWARGVVRDFAGGEAARALRELASHGLVAVAETREDSKARLVAEWRRKGVVQPAQNLILTNQNEEVRELNRSAQAERLWSGHLSEQFIQVAGQAFHVGDRVLFTRNSRMRGVSNGSLGTLTAIEGTCLKVTLDTGNTTRFALADYDHLRLGYAVTTHKAQGMTAENVFVLAGDTMQDLEISYVQSSRARGLTRFFFDLETAGEALETAIRQMGTSHAKLLASDIIAPFDPKFPVESDRNVTG